MKPVFQEDCGQFEMFGKAVGKPASAMPNRAPAAALVFNAGPVRPTTQRQIDPASGS